MFSDHDKTRPLIAAVSAPSVACSMLAVQQQKRLCRQSLHLVASYVSVAPQSPIQSVMLSIHLFSGHLPLSMLPSTEPLNVAMLSESKLQLKVCWHPVIKVQN